MRELMLITHFIGLSMAVGTGFANLFLGRAAAKLEPEERGNFMMKTMVLVRMGQAGLGLLIISGLYLITPYWSKLAEMPLLVIKLCLVLLLIVTVSVVSIKVRKALERDDPSQLMKIRPIGMLNFFIGIIIIIFAVLIFH